MEAGGAEEEWPVVNPVETCCKEHLPDLLRGMEAGGGFRQVPVGVPVARNQRAYPVDIQPQVEVKKLPYKGILRLAAFNNHEPAARFEYPEYLRQVFLRIGVPVGNITESERNPDAVEASIRERKPGSVAGNEFRFSLQVRHFPDGIFQHQPAVIQSEYMLPVAAEKSNGVRQVAGPAAYIEEFFRRGFQALFRRHVPPFSIESPGKDFIQ